MVIATTYRLRESLKANYSNNFVDKLHQLYTPFAILSFFFFIFLRLYINDPIICFENAYDLPVWYWFITNYCFVERKFYVPENITSFDSTNDQFYYPLVPFILILQVLLLLSPNFLWQLFNFKTGFFFHSLTSALAMNQQHVKDILGTKHVKIDIYSADPVSVFLGNLKYNSNVAMLQNSCFSQRTYLIRIYYLYKLANLFIAFIQLYFFNYFFGTSFNFWGAEMVWNIYHKKSWKITGYFPRNVYCNVPRRDDVTGMSFNSPSMCLLSYNSLFEKYFIIMWFWLAFLVVVNVISILKLIYFHLHPTSFLEKLLNYSDIDRSCPGFQYFLHEVLGIDGVLTLRILAANCPPIMLSMFTFDLFSTMQLYFPEN